MGQQDGNGNDMQAGQRRRHTSVVTYQATEARHPGEPALDHPAPRQHDNASLAVGGGIGCRLRTGVALVNKGHLHRVAGHLLHTLRQRRHLRPVLFVGWRDQNRQHLPQRIHSQTHR